MLRRGVVRKRYYVTGNNAQPFIGYQANVMTGIGLWSVDVEVNGSRRAYMVRPGPYLEHFMTRYLELVNWAVSEMERAISGFDAPGLAPQRS